MKMSTMIFTGYSEREEGEIIDDDLESISDDSITATPNMGKFNSQKENLRALSLSSISDIEVVERQRKCCAKKRKMRRKSFTSSKRTRISKSHNQRIPQPRVYSESSSDTDENVSLTKKLLHEAIRIDKKDTHNNSLRTRLRGMVAGQNNNDVEVPTNIQPIPDTLPFNEATPLGSEENKEYNEHPVSLDQDDELVELRLAALKTAVINKFQHRKKRNINNIMNKPTNLEINKENSSDNINSHSTTESAINCGNEISYSNDLVGNSIDNSEDEDILRAVLLSSIAKKITNKVISPKTKSKPNTENTSEHSIKQIKSNIPHPIELKPKGDLNIPKIPRFIISVNNSDSDSDDNNLHNNIGGDNVSKITRDIPHLRREVENEVEMFLKQQRAEVEATQKLSSRDPAVKSCAPPVVTTKNAEKNSVYKLLPKSKQLEYEKLIQRLNSAEKTPRTKKIPNKISDTKISRLKASKNEETYNVAVSQVQRSGEFQRTLKDMQTQINGRLQIKGKYHVLTPLMKKMNEATREQKKHEIRIKSLLKQLHEARNQSQKSQQSFKGLLKEFFKKKEEIDKSTTNEKVISRLPVTSEPKCAALENKAKEPTTRAPMTLPVEPLKSSIRQETLQCKVILEKCPDNLTDPNDIVFRKVGPETSSKYTSPLDNNISSSIQINPMEILCPFEMNGICRDKECSFNHCSQIK